MRKRETRGVAHKHLIAAWELRSYHLLIEAKATSTVRIRGFISSSAVSVLPRGKAQLIRAIQFQAYLILCSPLVSIRSLIRLRSGRSYLHRFDLWLGL
jgi:hypothetical protein